MVKVKIRIIAIICSVFRCLKFNCLLKYFFYIHAVGDDEVHDLHVAHHSEIQTQKKKKQKLQMKSTSSRRINKTKNFVTRC